jgi:hypothetical protein
MWYVSHVFYFGISAVRIAVTKLGRNFGKHAGMQRNNLMRR